MSTSVTVEFGSVSFTGTEIKSARLVEEIDPLAIELHINTLELTILSTDGDFSIVNPSGFFANLQYKQPLEVYETFDGTPVYIGTFYLDEWESLSENEARFRASDAIGLLESQTCYGYTIPDDALESDELIDAIETETGITINLDASLENIDIGGWIPVTTYREALQQICFVLGAYATCARSDQVNIFPMQLASELTTYDHTITASEKGLGQPIVLLPLVTGAEVHSHLYLSNGDESGYQEVFNSTLAAGDHRIVFDGPKWVNFSITGATQTGEGTNYVDINVASPGTVTILATEMIDTTKPYTVNNGSLPVGTKQNIITITDATLVTHKSGGPDIDPQDVAQRVYDYYQQRYLQKARFFAQQVAPGESVLISAQSGWIAGIIERMETDLAGGFVSQVDIIGVIASTCTNVLTGPTAVSSGNTLTYEDCLDLLDYSLDLQGSAELIIN